MHAALAADAVHRDNVRVVQAGGGLGLDAEPLDLPGVHRGGHRQQLQRHAAAERDLLGLVDDAHAAAAEFPQEPEIAQDPGRSPRLQARPGRQMAVAGDRRLAEVHEGLQRRYHAPDRLGVLRVLPDHRLQVHLIARLEALDEVVDELLQGGVQLTVGRPEVVAAGDCRSSSRSSSRSRNRATARISRDLTAPSPRPRTTAVSAVESPSRNRMARTSRSRSPSPAIAARTRSRISVPQQVAARAGPAGHQSLRQGQCRRIREAGLLGPLPQ